MENSGMDRTDTGSARSDDSGTDRTVIGIFDHVSAANDAVTALVEAGFAKDRIHVSPMASEDILAERRRRPKGVEVRRYTTRQAAVGLGFVIGFVGGGFIALLMSLGVLVVMGAGQAMFVGPVLATIIGAVLIGALGALFGFLSNANLPLLDPEPQLDESWAKATLVSVVTDAENADAARAVMGQHHARDDIASWRYEDRSLLPAVTA